MSFERLELIIDYQFKDKNLLKQALTHPSMAHKATYVQLPDYERLELLGDVVISLVITELLLQHFPDNDEGELAKKRASLIQGSRLSQIALQLSLDQFILMSDGEERAGGKTNPRILENVIEAIMGAIYLDGGLAEVKTVIERYWREYVLDADNLEVNPKAQLQEWAQQNGKPIPQYRIIDRQGPDHKPLFTIEVQVEGMPNFSAQAHSRKEAEKLAAQTLINYQANHDDTKDQLD